jgi:hypothetical protein
MPLNDIVDIRCTTNRSNNVISVLMSNATIHLYDKQSFMRSYPGGSPSKPLTATTILSISSMAMALGSKWLAYPGNETHDQTTNAAAAIVPDLPSRSSSFGEYSLTDVAQGVASGMYYLSEKLGKQIKYVLSYDDTYLYIST